MSHSYGRQYARTCRFFKCHFKLFYDGIPAYTYLCPDKPVGLLGLGSIDQSPQVVRLLLREVVALGLDSTGEDVPSHGGLGEVVPPTDEPEGHRLLAGGHLAPTAGQVFGASKALAGRVGDLFWRVWCGVAHRRYSMHRDCLIASLFCDFHQRINT